MIEQDHLELKGSPKNRPQLRTRRELLQAFDGNVAKARKALSKTNDQHLLTTWKLIADGKLFDEKPRHIMLRDGVFNHFAHHRGQLTVDLRLNDASVPSIYGPSADDKGW